MEKVPESNEGLRKLSPAQERMLELGLADEIRAGREIDASLYESNFGEEMTNEGFLKSLFTFLALPIIVDSFTEHREERVPAYNESGILEEFGVGAFLDSKLRLNRLAGVRRTLSSSARLQELSPELRQCITEQIADIQLSGYNDLPDEQKIEIAEKLNRACITVVNKAIDTGEVSGPYIV